MCSKFRTAEWKDRLWKDLLLSFVDFEIKKPKEQQKVRPSQLPHMSGHQGLATHSERVTLDLVFALRAYEIAQEGSWEGMNDITSERFRFAGFALRIIQVKP